MTPGGYQALADLLRQQIATGVLLPGQRIPSEATLAQTYGLARTTVRRAVSVLAHEGLIDVRHGYPSRVRDISDVADVAVPVDSRIGARMPTAEERRADRIPPGVPLLMLLDVLDGTGRPVTYRADRFRLVPTVGVDEIDADGR